MGKLHLTGVAVTERNWGRRKNLSGGLMATGCVNSLTLGPLVLIHLGFLSHLQALCMHTTQSEKYRMSKFTALPWVCVCVLW